MVVNLKICHILYHIIFVASFCSTSFTVIDLLFDNVFEVIVKFMGTFIVQLWVVLNCSHCSVPFHC